jgi:hypothetical protein
MAFGDETGSLSGSKAALVARHSPFKAGAFIAFVGAMLVVTLWGPSLGLHPKPGWSWLRWPLAVLFGLLILFWLRALFNDRPQIVIDSDGIRMTRWSSQTIPWEAIRACRVERQSVRWPAYKRHICLFLHNPDAFPRTARGGRFLGRGWNLGYGDITMMTVGLDHGIEDMWEAIEYFAPAEVEVDGEQLGGGRGQGPHRKRG